MKKYIFFVFTLMASLTGLSQTYNMEVILNDGSKQVIPADNVSEVRFVVSTDDPSQQEFNILTEEYIPDAGLRKAIKTQVAEGRETLTNKEAAAYTGGLKFDTPYISNFKGLEFFTSLTSLRADGIYATSLDVSMLPNLTELLLNRSQIKDLNLGNPQNLRILDICNTQLTNFDLSVLPNEMTTIKVDKLGYTSLDFTRFTNIEEITCSQNKLTSLNVSGLANLKNLYFSTNELTEVSLSGCSSLVNVVGTYNLNLTSIDHTGCTSIETFMFMYTALEQVDVTPFAATIRELNLGWTNITSLNISNCSNLTYLAVNNCNISEELDFTACTNLDELRVESTHIPSIDLTNCPNISVLHCYDIDKLCSLKLASHLPNLYQLNVDNVPMLETFEWGTTEKLQYANIYMTPLKRIDLSGVNTDYRYIYLEYNSNLTEIKVWEGFDLDNPPVNIAKDATAKFVYEFSE
ncbi:MAG: leucine-rich repeat domain-containing protein [Muribaculaceae bacterium]